MPEDDYKVGYKRPPKSGQFKPGQSGNSNGRPKKPKPVPGEGPADVLKRADERKILVSGRLYTPFELEIMALQAKAAKGDVAASRQLARLRKDMGLLVPAATNCGGVLVVPAPPTIEDFEAAAFRQQARFRKRIDED